MKKSYNKDKFIVIFDLFSKYFAYITAFFMGVCIFILFAYVFLGLLFPNQATWPLAFFIFPLTYSVVIIFNPKRAFIQVLPVSIFILSMVIWWFFSLSSDDIGYGLLLSFFPLLTVNYLIKNLNGK